MTVKITAQQLKSFSPNTPDMLAMSLAPALQIECNAHGITTNRRLRHFLAQIAHESAGFRAMAENLNYTPDGLMATFGPKRISAADCHAFGRLESVVGGKKVVVRVANQNAIANIVYGGEWGRKNLGNTQPGDGWRYRGRTPIQLTGRANYDLMQKQTGLPLVTNPDMAAEAKYAALIAVAWWESKGLNAIADTDAGEKVYRTIKDAVMNNELDDMRQARQRINGGTNGLKDAQDWLLRAAPIWPG